jgi:hypothetical protein
MERRDRCLGEFVIHEVSERGSTPPRQRPLKRGGRAPAVTSGQGCSTLSDIGSEAVRVDLDVCREQTVPLLPCLDHTHPGATGEASPKLGDVHLNGILCASGRLVAPDRVDQLLGTNEIASMDQQHREDRPHLSAAELDGAFATPHVERTQDAELKTPRPHPSIRSLDTDPPGRELTDCWMGSATGLGSGGSLIESPLDVREQVIELGQQLADAPARPMQRTQISLIDERSTVASTFRLGLLGPGALQGPLQLCRWREYGGSTDVALKSG